MNQKRMIVLDHAETRIFSLLLDCVEHERLPVVLRVAGGWVRDKLLGHTTHDIDIAIDKMMGRAFVDRLGEFLQKEGRHSSDATGEDKVWTGGAGTIKSNPEKSKHLETATMWLCDRSVDFVNLRSETYAVDHGLVGANGLHPTFPPPSPSASPFSFVSSSSCSTITSTTTTNTAATSSASTLSSSGSRIPVRVAFGSPLEDAQRRDITINALFYNLHTGQVEDFCGSGLSDLAHGLIRTPLDPLITLLDDPLRLLRVIRFASRFKYVIVEELMMALHDHRVHTAFRMKVSRERVGVEVDKMLSSGDDCGRELAMRYLLHERIYPLLLPQDSPKACTTDMEALLGLYFDAGFSGYHVDKRLAAYCLLLMPLASSNGKYGATSGSAVLAAVRDGLKLPGRDYNLFAKVVDGLFMVGECCDLDDPVRLGRIIMVLGEHWRLSCLLCDGYSRLFSVQTPVTGAQFEQAAARHGLGDCYKWRPLLNGDNIKALFKCRDGRQVGEILKKATDLQLCDPNTTREKLEHDLLQIFRH